MQLVIKEEGQPVTLTLVDTLKMGHIDRAEKAVKAREAEQGELSEVERLGINLVVLVKAVDGVVGAPYDFDRFYNDLDWDPEVMSAIGEALTNIFRSKDLP